MFLSFSPNFLCLAKHLKFLRTQVFGVSPTFLHDLLSPKCGKILAWSERACPHKAVFTHSLLTYAGLSQCLWEALSYRESWLRPLTLQRIPLTLALFKGLK